MRGASREGSPPLAFLSPNRMVHLWRSYSGGSRQGIRRAEGLPRGRGKTSPCCLLPHRLFLLGEVLLFALEGAGAGESSCPVLAGAWRAGRSGRPGRAVWKFFCAEGMPVAGEGCLRGFGVPLIFFVRYVKKKQSGRCENIFYDTRLPGSGGQGLLPPKAGKSAIARKKILPAVKKT